jgi:UDP-glucose 4-epimerase
MILLTGASGFIGKHLLKALIKEYGRNDVLALTSEPIKECPYLLHKNYSFSNDFFVENKYSDLIKTILHVGAFIPKNSSQVNNWEKCNQNIFNSQKLLEANLPNLENVIYLSTIDVYASADLITEESPIGPVSLYGQSKLYTERMLQAWASAEKKTIQILRIGHVYGPGEEKYEKLIPVTMRKIAVGSPVEIWGNGLEVRAFVYIDDIIKAIIKSLKLDSFIGAVNLVSSNSISISALLDKIINISGKEVAVKVIPTSTGGRNLKFDNSKMKQYLTSEETSLDIGLTHEWLYMQSLVS